MTSLRSCFLPVLFLAVLGAALATPETLVKDLNEDNWRELLDQEWMVEFYAPWCPACNALQNAWRELSLRADSKLGIHTAAVDVTTSPGLSGRFVVTALPTIYHVKNGEFRQYKGARDTDSMMTWLSQGKWRQIDPMPSWKAPDSVQMSLVANFFKLSQALRGVHTMLMETYGLPTWGSYLIFALATIFIGALLGLVLVCIIDLLYPAKRSDKVFVSQNEVGPGAGLLHEDLVDDERQSDAEKNSGSDTQSSDNEENSSQKTSSEENRPEAGDQDSKDSEVRKRRPRKAD